MSKSTRKIIMFIALFSVFSSMSTLIYKTIYKLDIPWFLIAGGLICGLVLAYLIRSYDSDDDYMPKNSKKLK